MSWPLSRILSLAAAYYRGGEAATIHLDTPLPGASSGLPAGSGEQPSGACAAAPLGGILGLASGGVCLAIPVTRNAGALLPHRFTLTTVKVAVCFLWHFPASHLGLPLAITLLCEVRTFLEPSAAPVPHGLANAPRPPSQLIRSSILFACRRCRLPVICSGPKIWSMPATPRPSPSTTWPRPLGCLGPTSAGCSPGRSVNRPARICRRGGWNGPQRYCATLTGRWPTSA